MIKRSIVLTGVEPRAEREIPCFRTTVEKFCAAGFRVFEYCSDMEQLKEKADFVKSLGGESIFLLAIYQKRSGKSLGDLCEEHRKQAVEEVLLLVQGAVKAGVRKFLLTSGPKTEPQKMPAALKQLGCSLCELLEETADDVYFVLEPGDTEVQFCQMIGPTTEAVRLIEKIGNPRMSLVMDTSHIRQLGESVEDAMKMSQPWCSHIHLANCILKRSNDMYGDKHPFFGAEDGELTKEDMVGVFAGIQQLYHGKDLTVSVEIINHDQEADFANQVLENIDWLLD